MPGTSIVYEATPAVERNRLTVFFRMFMVLPHIVTVMIYGIGAGLAVIVAWFALVFTGSYPAGLFDFVAKTMRYNARLSAYAGLLVDEYPPFDLGEHPEYPVRLHIGPAQETYSRAKVFFRALLYIPVAIILYVLQTVGNLIGIVIWLGAVFLGRTSEGLANIELFCLSYSARAGAYAFLLTDDWPAITQEPGAVAPAAASADLGVPSTPVPPPPPAPPANPFG